MPSTNPTPEQARCLRALHVDPCERSPADLAALARVLCKSRIFSKLRSSVLKHLCGTCRYRSIRGSSLVFRKGDPANQLLVLVSGAVSIWLPQNEEGGGEATSQPTTLPPTRQPHQESSHRSARALTEAAADAASLHRCVGVIRAKARNATLGEMGLMSPDARRTATVRADVFTECIVIDKHDFDSALKRLYDEDLHAKLKDMRHFPLLKTRTTRFLTRLSLYLVDHTASLGREIYKQGEPANYIYFIISGSVEVTHTVTNAPASRAARIETRHARVRFASQTVRLAELGRGQVFGLDALQPQRAHATQTPTYQHAVRCLSQCRMFRMSRDDVQRRLKNSMRRLHMMGRRREAFYLERIAATLGRETAAVAEAARIQQEQRLELQRAVAAGHGSAMTESTSSALDAALDWWDDALAVAASTPRESLRAIKSPIHEGLQSRAWWVDASFKTGRSHLQLTMDLFRDVRSRQQRESLTALKQQYGSSQSGTRRAAAGGATLTRAPLLSALVVPDRRREHAPWTRERPMVGKVVQGAARSSLARVASLEVGATLPPPMKVVDLTGGH